MHVTTNHTVQLCGTTVTSSAPTLLPPGPLLQVEREINIHSSLNHAHIIDFVSRSEQH